MKTGRARGNDAVRASNKAAFRLEELVIDPDNREWDIPYDPVLALHYYQVAEIGLRIEVANDSLWYAGRLEQAIAVRDKEPARFTCSIERLPTAIRAYGRTSCSHARAGRQGCLPL